MVVRRSVVLSRRVVSSAPRAADVRTGAALASVAVAAGGQIKSKRGSACAGAAAAVDKFGTGLLGMGGATTMQPARGAFHAAALACGAVPGTSSRSSRAGVVAKAGASSRGPIQNKPKYENVGVFNVSTEKLPGGDKMTNEGILGFVLAGFLAFWFGTTAIRTFAVMIGFIFTSAKYFAMGIALLLIGVAVS